MNKIEEMESDYKFGPPPRSIIDKLGMNTPDEIVVVSDAYKIYDLAGLKRPLICYLNFDQASILKKHLDEKNELLEALIDIALCDFEDKRDHKEITDVIEKVCYPMKWKKIKELKK